MHRPFTLLLAGFAGAAGVVGLVAGPAAAGPTCTAGPGNGDFLGGRLGNKPLTSTDFVNVDIDSET